MTITLEQCMRAQGHSVVICSCKTAEGFLPCPEAVQRHLTPVYPPAAYGAVLRGDPPAAARESRDDQIKANVGGYLNLPAGSPSPAVSISGAKYADPIPVPTLPGPRLVYSAADTHKIARQSGYTGNQCPNCYSVRMRWNGTCEVCDECGTQGGCS